MPICVLNKIITKQKNREKIKRLGPQDIVKAVCSFYNIRLSHLKGETRASSVVLPRQIAMLLLRRELKLKLEEVAFLLKRKDHTTVIHAIEKINRLMMKDPALKKDIDQIVNSLSLST